MCAAPLARVEAFLDADTGTFTYVLFSTEGGGCAIIDPVLNFDAAAGRTSTVSADEVMRFVAAHGLQVEWLLETHVHADHLSAAHYIRQQTGGTIAMGAGLHGVQGVFRHIFGELAGASLDGSGFGRLLEPDEVFNVGGLRVRAMHVPGHTPADMAYAVDGPDGVPSMVFVGDTLFMPDVGSARCDFPGGNATTLFQSVRRLLALPAGTRLFMCHDYPPPGREPRFETTVQAQRAENIHLHEGVNEAQFVQMRQARDSTLNVPALMLAALQVNLRGGSLPPPQGNGVRYLQIPLNALDALSGAR